MALIDTVIIFLINLLIGGTGIYIGARVVTNENDFSYAVISALIGAIVWSIFSFFVGGLAVIGPILTLLAWIWVIKSRYRTGWLNASLIGLVSWAAVLATLIVLSWFNVTSFTAIGVPL